MRAPRSAVALISVLGRNDGVNEITFALKDGSRKKVLEVAGHPTVLERLWLELDTTMDSLMNVAALSSPDEDAVQRLRIRARTQAETLVIFMTPFFNNVDEVAREAKKRYDARQAGDDSYTTPGLSDEDYVPPAVNTSSKFTVKRTGNRVPNNAVDAVRQALETKMFTVDEIAASYNMTPDEVKEQFPL